MAARCQLGQHGNCAICSRFTPSDQRGHVHEFNRKEPSETILCSECYGCVIRSAHVILQALQAAGIRYSNAEELKHILSEQVLVVVQDQLFPHADAQN